MERINLNLLRALNALLEHRNVTRAAEKLNISQSAMSRQLGQLRTYFDDEILIREGGDYLLSALAQELKPSIQSIVSQVDNLRNETQKEPEKYQRSFTFSSTDYVANFIFPDVIKAIQAKAPGIDIHYRQWQPDWINQLGSLPIDFASTMTSAPPENLYGIHLGQDHPVVLMKKSHPLSSMSDISLPKPLEFPFIRITAGGDKDGFFDTHLEKKGLKRRVAVETPFFTSAFNICESSEMLVIVPRHIAENARKIHAVSWRELGMDDLPQHEYYLLWHSIHHHDQAHRWLRELIAEIMEDSIFSPQGMQ
ncbi:LysR family transcriptional regulator [Halomonas sp. HG01]|uniref:LysR family transcriptional regulator n=1 Tax=Halomonas sp. HG01 TaxID=1609967 RepID=UPI000B0BB9D9|nr:LysR family transcriptional regulator [Halomonas sp. HG01]